MLHWERRSATSWLRPSAWKQFLCKIMISSIFLALRKKIIIILREFTIFPNAWRKSTKPFYFKPWRRVQRTRQQGMFQCERTRSFTFFGGIVILSAINRRTKSMILLVYVIAEKCRKIFRTSDCKICRVQSILNFLWASSCLDRACTASVKYYARKIRQNAHNFRFSLNIE